MRDAGRLERPDLLELDVGASEVAVLLLGAIAAGSWQISRGQAIEPAAVVSKIATIIGERLAKATAS